MISEEKIKKENSSHRMIQGDSLESLENVPDNSIDLVFADPPYDIGKEFGSDKGKKKRNGEYLEWCKEWINEVKRVLKPDGAFYLMAATQHMPKLDLYCREEFDIINRIVWFYDSSGRQASTKYGSRYEPILFCTMNENDYTFNYDDITVKAKTGADRELIDYRKDPPEPYSNEKNPGNVWEFSRVRYRMPEYIEHPSQKPELLLERIIRASSNKGDTVLDPFAGTFTTSAVSAKLGRNSVSIEIEEEFYEKGIERINDCVEGQEIANKHNHEEDKEEASIDQFGDN